MLELEEEDGRLIAGRPVDLTDRQGYDNQPAFLPGGQALLYASRQEDQVEIRQYDLGRRESAPLTRTREREYQPQPLPDGQGFSAVRVELDGKQRLWRFDSRGRNATPLIESVDDVFAYVWVDPQTIAVVDARDPHNLWLFDLQGGAAKRIVDRAGRSIQRVPGRSAISFIHEVAPDERWVKELDLGTGEVRPLVLARPGSEDHAWTPSGSLVMGQGSRLFQWSPGPGAAWERWRVIDDFSLVGLSRISRVAVSPDGDRLVFVCRKAGSP